ncbi:MAG: hypothetical protein OEZ58_17510 [Gammaproteobacteria bacterium]|nr:hypothetical protein [Gammaproteobacteria bacterium]MDH5730789.1 hypothetical protein [Gammaproteobacteria bacterium]
MNILYAIGEAVIIAFLLGGIFGAVIAVHLYGKRVEAVKAKPKSHDVI